MTLEEAKQVILTEPSASADRLASAAFVLCLSIHGENVTLFELLECMRRGNALGREGAFIDEAAALQLYARTCRPRTPNHAAYEDFIRDAEDWSQYLLKQKLI